MATALDVVKSFCYREGLTIPAGISFESPTDPGTLKLLHTLYAVVEQLRAAKVWTVQKRTYTFDLEADRESYPLPQDFYAPLPLTHYDADNTRRLYGPTADSQFTYMLYVNQSGPNTSYRLFGPDFNPNTATGQFQVYPSPTSSTITIAFEYVSRNLFLPKHWAPSTAYTSGMYVNSNGNIYLCDTSGTSSSAGPYQQTTNITDGTTRWDYVSTPYETIVDDNDINLFDDDLIKLGLRAKWFESSGEEYANATAEFEKRIEQAVARYSGSYVGSLIPDSGGPRYTVPDGNWST